MTGEFSIKKFDTSGWANKGRLREITGASSAIINRVISELPDEQIRKQPGDSHFEYLISAVEERVAVILEGKVKARKQAEVSETGITATEIANELFPLVTQQSVGVNSFDGLISQFARETRQAQNIPFTQGKSHRIEYSRANADLIKALFVTRKPKYFSDEFVAQQTTFLASRDE